MLKIYTIPEARKSILNRRAIDNYALPASVLSNIENLFGDALSPEQAVARILSEIRNQGDAALRKWAITLDGKCPENFRVPAEEIEIAMNSISKAQKEALELSIQRVRNISSAAAAIILDYKQPGRYIGSIGTSYPAGWIVHPGWERSITVFSNYVCSTCSGRRCPGNCTHSAPGQTDRENITINFSNRCSFKFE